MNVIVVGVSQCDLFTGLQYFQFFDDGVLVLEQQRRHSGGCIGGLCRFLRIELPFLSMGLLDS